MTKFTRSALKTLVLFVTLSSIPVAVHAEAECPLTRKVRFADKVLQFKSGVPAGPDTIEYRARIGEIFGACELKNGALDIKLEISFVVERGPKVDKYAFAIPYFVAVHRTSDQTLQKIAKTVDASIGRNTTAEFKSDVSEKVKVAPTDTLENLELFIGFQLTEEQLKYNRQSH
ncbi:MAG: hypothetical protein R3E60_05830 [Alphaproteobacteria bacterium]